MYDISLSSSLYLDRHEDKENHHVVKWIRTITSSNPLLVDTHVLLNNKKNAPPIVCCV